MANEPSPSMFAATDRYAAQFGDAVLLVARILLGWLFFYTAYSKMMGMPGLLGYLGALGVPAYWAWPSTIIELVLGAALILGIATRYCSLLTALFVIVVTWVAHRYWTYPAPRSTTEFNQFINHLALVGGLFALFITGPGRYSLDAMLRKR